MCCQGVLLLVLIFSAILLGDALVDAILSNLVEERQSRILTSNTKAVNALVNYTFGEQQYKHFLLRPSNYLHIPSIDNCHMKFLVLVFTKPNDFEQRALWRNVYGEWGMRNKFRYCAIFPIGLLHSSSEKLLLEEEINLFGDILQGDYVESYRNLTLKTLSALRYAAIAYPTMEAVMKIDDDVAWNVPKVANYIKQVLPRSISCYKYNDRSPIRKPTSKWYTSYNEFSQKKFPQYCSGVAYIIHKDALIPMLKVVPELEFFWIDDVFITGFLTRNAGINFVKLNQFTALKPLRKKLLNITFYSDYMFYGNNKQNIGRKFVQHKQAEDLVAPKGLRTVAK